MYSLLPVCVREHAPSIIFMDEVDSIGSARTENSGGGGDSEVQRTMLELLNQLDGFEASNKIKVRLCRAVVYISSAVEQAALESVVALVLSRWYPLRIIAAPFGCRHAFGTVAHMDAGKLSICLCYKEGSQACGQIVCFQCQTRMSCRSVLVGVCRRC